MSYHINLTGDDTRTFEVFSDGREAAEKIAKDEGIELELVHTPTDAVAYVATPREPGTIFDPWTRVETPKFAAPHLDGWRPAYTRKRIEATVYRNISRRGWLIHDGRTGGRVEVSTTKEACQVTSEMRAGRML